jgi:hypothetical protein
MPENVASTAIGVAKSVHWKARLLFAGVLCAGAAAGAEWYAWSSSHSRTYEIVSHDAVHGLILTAPVGFAIDHAR